MFRPLRWAFFFFVVAAGASCAAAEPSARETLEAIRKARLDPTQLYRVHEASFYREELRVYLTEGTLAFLQPVMGRVTGAVFVGQGEVLLIPPDSVEKRSMARYTGSPVLNEKFSSAIFRFTDDTYERLREAVANQQSAEPIRDDELVEKWNPVVGNLHGVHEMRVLTDFFSFKPVPFFSARLSGETLGNFDITVDYRASEQMVVGQPAVKEERRYNNVWCSFVVRSVRTHTRPAPADWLVPVRYRLNSRIEPSRLMKVTAEVEFQAVTGGERVLQFELSRFLKVSSVQLLNKPDAAVDVEFSQNELLEEHEVRRRGNDQVTVILPQHTQAGKPFALRFTYEGEVIADSGNGVLFVGARGSWYPNRGLRPAIFDMTFSCPRRLTLVATGDRISDKEEGDWRVSRWTSRIPVRLAGFNLGDYEKGETRAGTVQVEVYSNKSLEPELERRHSQMMLVDPATVRPGQLPGSRRNQAPLLITIPGTPQHDASEITTKLARDAARNVDFYLKQFGPLPFRRVAISPIPGSFGQGWPGLVYLSTAAFSLQVESVPSMPRVTEIFYRTLLSSHELAHQWWGNLVPSGTYRDEWLIESLSNYSALMYMETRKDGDRDVRLLLDKYREDLLEKVEDEPAERTGPPVLGYRLTSSQSPRGMDLVMYKKGTWVIHMLRELMRDPRTGSDANFDAFLRSLCINFRDKVLTTEEFRRTAEKFVVPAANVEGKTSLEWFFDNWVYATGIPEVRVHSSVSSKTGKSQVKGQIEISGVDQSFSLPIPIFAQTMRGPVFVGVVSALGKETSFTLNSPVLTQKVAVDPHGTLLAVMH